jgi:PKD domain
MMRRYSFNARRTLLALGATLVATLGVATTAAQAVVVTDNGTTAGVALTPSSRNSTLPTGVTAAPPAATNPCDPWLAPDLGPLPSEALCYGGGGVIHKNETFALTWDQPRAYWAVTRGYMEQFLRDVADSSGSLASPYAVATQYNDAGGRAANASIFGGGCIDYGATGGSSCEYGAPNPPGHNYPTTGNCPVSGDSFVTPAAVTMNTACLTDAQLQSEVATMVSQTRILGNTKAGYTPLVTLLVPPRVKVCLDGAGALCSVNGSLTPPPPNVTSANTSSGKIADGTYRVVVTYDDGSTESAPSSSQIVTTVSGNSQNSSITITSPPLPPVDPAPGHTWSWNAYVTASNGFQYMLQDSALVGTDITLNGLTANTKTPPANTAFCSYHSRVNVGGTEVAYVVQPWTAGSECDEPDAPSIPPFPTPQQMAVGVGERLVSPLSQAEIAAITDPGLDGWTGHAGPTTTPAWSGNSGDEIDDNAGCVPEGNQLDKVTLGTSSQNPYFLQRESNNAGLLEFDPATYFGCAPQVDLAPAFVVPSAVDAGDVVQFDGSATDSTLIVPQAGYQWDFGDGTKATGPSEAHSYAKGGTYNVTLTVTDRGGNTNTLTQTIQVLGDNGQPGGGPPPTESPGSGSGSSGSGSGSSGSGSGSGGSGAGSAGGAALSAHLQLMPQSLKSVLRNGIALRVSSNKAANGIATVWITRAAAKRAHLQVGKAPAVRIGIGTVSSITNGSVTLRLHLSSAMAKKLSHLGHVTMTVRLALVAAGSQQFAIDVAGSY